MIKYDLDLTSENIFDTYINDSIRRNQELFNTLELLLTIECGYSIALDGAWGSGKSFFCKQLEMLIMANNQYIENIYNSNQCDLINKKVPSGLKEQLNNSPLAVTYYDAWKNDNDEDPVLSLLYTIVSAYKVSDFEDFKINLEELFKSVISIFSPIKIDKVVSSDNILTDINNKKIAESEILNFFKGITSEKGTKLIVIIDELDRCRPSYAIKMLERIKHYFSMENIIFIFSVNCEQLQHSISKEYGEHFDSGRYLDRFFDIHLTLPKIDAVTYLTEKVSNGRLLDIGVVIATKHNLEMREMCRYLVELNRLQKSMEKRASYIEVSGYNYIHSILLPICSVLKITNPAGYRKFIDGKDSNLLDVFFNDNDLSRMCHNLLLTYDERKTYNIPIDSIAIMHERIKKIYEYITTPSTELYRQEVQFGNVTIANEHVVYYKKMR